MLHKITITASFVLLPIFFSMGCQTAQPGVKGYCYEQQSRCQWDCQRSGDTLRRKQCWDRCEAARNGCLAELPATGAQ